jgi:hypothetical protein
MKGYFSRIAKQSGIRFSEQRAGKPPTPAGEPVAESLSPLHREETFVIPSPLQGKKLGGALETRRAVKPEVSQKHETAANIVTEKKLKSETSQDTSIRTVHYPAEEPDLKERHMVSAQTENNEDQSTVKSDVSVSGDKPTAGLSVSKQTVFMESGRRDGTIQQSGQALAAELAERDAVKPSEHFSDPDTESKNYFSKTAEIIEKGEAGTTEIQKILLQEVQEWVAASPVSFDILDEKVKKPQGAIVRKEVAQPEEPHVVAVRGKVQPENTERSEFAEQTFDLSIGTITVVIEDSEKSRQPEPPPQTAHNQNSGRETKREFSRLSRNYI